MAMTLQDVFDAVKVLPRKYGFAKWFMNRKPYCPLAVEVLADLADIHDNPDAVLGLQEIAAERLAAPLEDVVEFMNWWDGHRYEYNSDTKYRRETLIRRGYNVPVEKELRDAGM